MSTEERELYELRQLIGNTEDILNKLPITRRDSFQGYEYKNIYVNLIYPIKIFQHG
jgi:hypothetical protein